MKNYLYVFLLCIGCSELYRQSGISAVTNITGTDNYPVQLTSSGMTREFQIPVPIVTISWYSGLQLLSNSNFYQTVLYSNNITAPSYIQTETHYPVGRYTNYYLWEIITNNVSNYSAAEYNYDVYELDLNSENQNTLLLNVTSTVPNTLAQSFKEKVIYTNKNNTNKIRQFYYANLRHDLLEKRGSIILDLLTGNFLILL